MSDSSSLSQFPERVKLAELYELAGLDVPDTDKSILDSLSAVRGRIEEDPAKLEGTDFNVADVAGIIDDALTFFSSAPTPQADLRGVTRDDSSPARVDSFLIRRMGSLLPKEPPQWVAEKSAASGKVPMRRIYIGPNRGDPVIRAIRAIRELSFELGYHIETVVMFSDVDRHSEYVRMADRAVYIPGGKDAYLNIDATMEALDELADEGFPVTHIDPGWGFLAENPAFAEAAESRGIELVGPLAESMRAAGSKTQSKVIARRNGIPVAEGTDDIPILPNGAPDVEFGLAEAKRIGYPVIIKPSEGGGGKGMVVVYEARKLPEALRQTVLNSIKNFNSPNVAIERFIPNARHIEVQILADGSGKPAGVKVVGIRNCSAQRRHQKMFEWSGPGMISKALEDKLVRTVQAYVSDISYKGPGTLEFLVDSDENAFFMEMNTRLQVEHLVSEERYGVDVKKESYRNAMGLDFTPHFLEVIETTPGRIAINFRIQAEDPYNDFTPSPGRIKFLRFPGGPHVRVDSSVQEGSEISPEFDSMIAKLTVTGDTWPEAVANLERALRETKIVGVKTNIQFGLELLQTDEFRRHAAEGITIPFMERYLGVRTVHVKSTNGQALTEKEAAILEKPEAAALIGRYGDLWTGSEYEDEALLGAALAAYKMHRAETEETLLSPRSTVRITRDTLPPSEGLYFNAVINGKKAAINVRELALERFGVTVNGRTVTIDAHRINEYQYSIRLLGTGEKAGDRQYEAVVDASGGTFDVEVDGVTHTVQIGSTEEQKVPGVVTAGLDSNVWRIGRKNEETEKYDIPLRIGDTVKAGEEILNLTVMKMEIPVYADVDGVVEELLVNTGDNVTVGQVIVKIRPLSTGTGAGEDASVAEEKEVVFMEGVELGPRAQIAFLDDADEDVAKATMDAVRERLVQDAPRMVAYVGEFLIGFDYTKGHLDRILTLLGEMDGADKNFKEAYLKVLQNYAELQTLFSEEYRPRFEYFLRHWKRGDYNVPKELRDILRANLAHFGIHFGEKEEIRPNKKHPEHELSNALLRIRQSWTDGKLRRGVIADLIRLAGRYDIKEAIPIIRQIYNRAEARGAATMTQAALETSKKLDLRFYEELVKPLIPRRHRPRYEELRADIFSGVSETRRESMERSLADRERRYQPASKLTDGNVKKLALALGVEVAKIYSPYKGVKVYTFRFGGDNPVESIVVYSDLDRATNFQIERGVIRGEDTIEAQYIRATQIIGMYNKIAGPGVFSINRLLFNVLGEVPYSERNGTPGAYSPEVLARIGANVFAFADGKSIESTTILASYGTKQAQIHAAFQFYADSSGGLMVRRIPQKEFFTLRDRQTARQHKRGKRTVEERAQAFFDNGEYEVIRVDGTDKPKIHEGKIVRDGDGNIVYESNGGVIARAKVDGRDAVAYFSDFRRIGGAVGDVEGQKMVAAAVYAYLNGLPIFWFNDSAGANVPEGVVSLNRSAEDFMMKVVTGGDADVEAFVRWIEHHPDRELFTRLIQQFGKKDESGRTLPLIEQLKGVKRPPFAVALGIGGNAGMVVYGPSLLAHVFMVNAREFFGLLTGTDVVYQVTRVRRSNYDLGGARVLLDMAGTIDEAVLTEDQIIELARKALKWFDPSFQFDLEGIQRVDPDQIVSAPEEEAAELTGSVLTMQKIAENVDGGVAWGYKEGFRNSSSLTASWARIGGRTVAIMGPLTSDGFGTSEAVAKAYRFARAANQERVPIIKVIGRRWIDSYSADSPDGDLIRHRHVLTNYLAQTDVPQISILMDPEAIQNHSGNVGSDFLIYVKTGAATEAEIWQAKKAGCIVVESFEEAMDKAAQYAKYMSYEKGVSPRRITTDDSGRTTEALEEIIPEVLKQPYDMHKAIEALVDNGEFFEVGSGTEDSPENQDGSNLITGFATVDGRVVGIIADQPAIRAGAPDHRGAIKYRRFVALCEKHRIPILALNDAPGFKPGIEEEGADIQGRGARSLKENILSTVPVVSVSLRKAYGGRFIHAFHRYIRPGIVTLATNRGQVAVMGERGGIPFTYKKEYRAWVPQMAQASQGFRTALRDTLDGMDDESLTGASRTLIGTLESTDSRYPFMHLDDIRNFLAANESRLPESMSEAVEAAREAIRVGEGLEERYRREVGAPQKAFETDVINKIVELTLLRMEVIAAFDQAEKEATAAFGRDWSTTTRAEAMHHYARALVHNVGLSYRSLVVDPNDSSDDVIVLDGIEDVMFEAEEIIIVLSLLGDEMELASLQSFLSRYAQADEEERHRILAELLTSRFEATLADQVQKDPDAVTQALEAGMRALFEAEGEGAVAAFLKQVDQAGARVLAGESTPGSGGATPTSDDPEASTSTGNGAGEKVAGDDEFKGSAAEVEPITGISTGGATMISDITVIGQAQSSFVVGDPVDLAQARADEIRLGAIEVYDNGSAALALNSETIDDVGAASLPRTHADEIGDQHSAIPEDWETTVIEAIALAERKGFTEVVHYLEFAGDAEAQELFTGQKGLFANLIEAGYADYVSQLSQAGVNLSDQEIIQINAAIVSGAPVEVHQLVSRHIPETAPVDPATGMPLIGTANGVSSVLRSPVLRVVR